MNIELWKGIVIGIMAGILSTVAVTFGYALLIDWFDRREKQDKFDGQDKFDETGDKPCI